MSEVVMAFARTLDQELVALTRGASLECLVCGEFVLHRLGGAIECPECGSALRAGGQAASGLQSGSQARGPRALRGSRKVRAPQGRTLGKPQAAKTHGKWDRKETADRRNVSRK